MRGVGDARGLLRIHAGGLMSEAINTKLGGASFTGSRLRGKGDLCKLLGIGQDYGYHDD